MPLTFNVNPPIESIGLNVRSVRVFLWPSAQDKSVEVAADQAHFVEYDAFTGNNQTGTNLGRGSIDTGEQSALQAFKAANAQDLLTKIG